MFLQIYITLYVIISAYCWLMLAINMLTAWRSVIREYKALIRIITDPDTTDKQSVKLIFSCVARTCLWPSFAVDAMRR